MYQKSVPLHKNSPLQAGSTAPKAKSLAKPRKGGMDTTFLVFTSILLGVGLIMLFSASYAYAYFYYGDSFHYISSQFIFALIGYAGMLVISYIDYHVLHRFALLVYGAVLILLMLTLFSAPINGSRRWVTIGIQFQPSEIAKFAIVLLFAHLISVYESRMKEFKRGFLMMFGLLVPVVGLVFAERHLSGTILITLLGIVMMFIGGVKMRWFMLVGSIGAAGIGAYVFLADKMAYAMQRIHVWLDPTIDPSASGHQILQSLYAIGSGGLLGQGLGNSRQKYLYVPEPQNDFIFSIICEELGFIGATIIILLYVLFIWRGFVIAMRARDKFGAMLVMGLTSQIGIQTILNIAVVTNTIPNTGISLPFFSSGGSSLIMLLFQMGVILSVSRYSVLEKR